MKASDVKKAVVLAAGFGTRLRPLTLVRPKPLLPMWGVPMLERILSLLEKWGVGEIAVNAHWQAEQVRRYVATRKGRAKVVIAEEPEILGTGGVLNPLRYMLGTDPFWLVNGDIVAEDLDPQPIVDAYEKSGAFAGCWMSEAFGPRTVEADREGRICNWKSDVAGDDGTFTYCGCAVLGPKVLDYVAPQGFSTIVQAYEKAAMDGHLVVGADPDGAFWADCGTLESYLETHAALDPDRFDENPNVIFPGVKLLDTADLAGCVVTGGLVGGAFEQTALVGVDQIHDDRLAALVREIGWTPEDAAAEFLGARGSDRSFWRLVHGDDRAIAIVYDDAKRPENARYAHHARLLAGAGVPVPRVLADLPSLRAVALEDLGDDALQDRANEKGAALVSLYTPVVKALRVLHEQGTEAALREEGDVLEPAFGPDLYKWERDLFETFCVKERYGYDALPDAVRADLETVAEVLQRQRPVLVHRDFQSSNVLYRPDGSLAFIDFQGMRLGAAAYDLASLLYDPYVPLDDRDRAALAKVYPVDMLAYGAVQRLVQALGAFGRLASVGQPQFGRYVPRALANLLEAADEADLDALGGFVEDLIAKEEIRLGHFHHHHHDDDEEE